MPQPPVRATGAGMSRPGMPASLQVASNAKAAFGVSKVMTSRFSAPKPLFFFSIGGFVFRAALEALNLLLPSY